jgi:hypothetical protein
MLGDWIPKLSDTISTVKKEVETGKDPKGKPITSLAIRQALKQQVPVLEGRRSMLEQRRDSLNAKKEALGKAGVSIPPITFEFLDQAGMVVASQTIPEQIITPRTLTVTSITRSGQTATVTTAAPHDLNGQSVTISGASPSQYNGTHSVNTTGNTTFTYLLTQIPTAPASGEIRATAWFPKDFELTAVAGGIAGWRYKVGA